MNITNRIVKPKPPRWYQRNGEGVWEVKAKSKDGMKPVTVREARELSLLPSVTSILQVIARPELEAWKIEQAIMAALTLPRLENEPTDAFAKRVVEDSEKQRDTAAEFGSTIHKCIEAHLTGDIMALQAMPAEVMPWLDEFIKWQETALLTVYHTEYVVVNEAEGYAGRLDIHGQLDGIGECVIDIKTQNVRDRIKFYDEWAMQLTAYSRAVAIPFPACVSLVIDSNKPSPPTLKIWDDLERHWMAFQHAFALWKYQKNYDPAL